MNKCSKGIQQFKNMQYKMFSIHMFPYLKHLVISDPWEPFADRRTNFKRTQRKLLQNDSLFLLLDKDEWCFKSIENIFSVVKNGFLLFLHE